MTRLTVVTLTLMIATGNTNTVNTYDHDEDSAEPGMNATAQEEREIQDNTSSAWVEVFPSAREHPFLAEEKIAIY